MMDPELNKKAAAVRASLPRDFHQPLDTKWSEQWHKDVRTNYGLVDRTPIEAGNRWFANLGYAPVGAIVALGCALNHIEEAHAEISRLKARVNALRERLDAVAFISHKIDCEFPCTCGLDELIGEAEE